MTPSEFIRRNDALEAEIYEKRARRAANAKKNAEKWRRAFGDLCEATEGLSTVWHRGETPLADMLAWADGDVLTLRALARWLRLSASREVDRLRHAARRPFYYQQEKARRQALAAERRKVTRRTTENPCPTKEQILDAWERVRNSNEDLLRFGSLMEDLACYVDSSLVRTEDGSIVGRRGGMKAWLQLNVPALYLKYKTVMAYKVAARKLKQITGLADPTPAARLVEEPRTDEPVEIVRARAVYHEVMGTGADRTRKPPRNRTAWLERVEAFADPERVEEATTLEEWKRLYECEITVRTKSKWMLRLKRLWSQTG